MVRFKCGEGFADHLCMRSDSTSTIGARVPRNVRVARKPINAGAGIIAFVIECIDKTCTVVGNGFALDCHSIQEAMGAVEDITPRVAWRERAPGFWVGRSAETSRKVPKPSTEPRRIAEHS